MNVNFNVIEISLYTNDFVKARITCLRLCMRKSEHYLLCCRSFSLLYIARERIQIYKARGHF